MHSELRDFLWVMNNYVLSCWGRSLLIALILLSNKCAYYANGLMYSMFCFICQSMMEGLCFDVFAMHIAGCQMKVHLQTPFEVLTSESLFPF